MSRRYLSVSIGIFTAAGVALGCTAKERDFDKLLAREGGAGQPGQPSGGTSAAEGGAAGTGETQGVSGGGATGLGGSGDAGTAPATGGSSGGLAGGGAGVGGSVGGGTAGLGGSVGVRWAAKRRVARVMAEASALHLLLLRVFRPGEQYEKRYYERALRVRTLIRADYERAFDPGGEYRLDCLLTATTPTTAFELGAVYGDSVLMQYADLLTVPADHAGIPGLSVPAGVDSHGLPIGVQFLGPDFSEATLFKVGGAFETASEAESWRNRRPEALAD